MLGCGVRLQSSEPPPTRAVISFYLHPLCLPSSHPHCHLMGGPEPSGQPPAPEAGRSGAGSSSPVTGLSHKAGHLGSLDESARAPPRAPFKSPMDRDVCPLGTNHGPPVLLSWPNPHPSWGGRLLLLGSDEYQSTQCHLPMKGHTRALSRVCHPSAVLTKGLVGRMTWMQGGRVRLPFTPCPWLP